MILKEFMNSWTTFKHDLELNIVFKIGDIKAKGEEIIYRMCDDIIDSLHRIMYATIIDNNGVETDDVLDERTIFELKSTFYHNSPDLFRTYEYIDTMNDWEKSVSHNTTSSAPYRGTVIADATSYNESAIKQNIAYTNSRSRAILVEIYNELCQYLQISQVF